MVLATLPFSLCVCFKVAFQSLHHNHPCFTQMIQFVAALVMGLNAIRIGCDFPMWMQVGMETKMKVCRAREAGSNPNPVKIPVCLVRLFCVCALQAGAIL